MIIKKLTLTICCCVALLASATAQSLKNTEGASKGLFNHLATKDSLLFNIIFKTCNLKDLDAILAKDFVFYHDYGYSSATSAQNYVGFVKFIKTSCENRSNGKALQMRREVVKGTLQIFPVNGTEVIQTGVQRFYVLQQGGKEKAVEESKFSRTWNKVNGGWKLSRELDYMVDNKPILENSGERYQPKPYVPEPLELYNKIVSMDSIYFSTYNTCDMEKMSTLMAEDLEFYHDRTGLSTSKKDVLESIKKNICGKVTRTLTKGSIEVYPIHDFGAVEIGYHSFHNIAEPGESKPSKFIMIWRLKDGQWQITRVVSLH